MSTYLTMHLVASVFYGHSCIVTLMPLPLSMFFVFIDALIPLLSIAITHVCGVL